MSNGFTIILNNTYVVADVRLGTKVCEYPTPLLHNTSTDHIVLHNIHLTTTLIYCASLNTLLKLVKHFNEEAYRNEYFPASIELFASFSEQPIPKPSIPLPPPLYSVIYITYNNSSQA